MQTRLVVPALVLASITSAPVAWSADPTTTDCLTASEASLKQRGEHKLREARRQLLVCSAPNCPADVRNECLRRVDQVNAAIPTIIFEAKDAAGNDVSDVSVTMDGEALADRLEGTAISLDPGQHVFHFEAAGQPPVDKTLVIHEAEKDRHEQIVIGAGPSATPSVVPTRVTPLQGSTVTNPALGPGTASSSWSTQKTTSLVVGGVGVAGLIAGGVFAGIASAKWSASKTECSSGGGCPQYSQAVSDHDSASTAATVSTVAVVVGGAAVVAAAVLWFTAPSGGESAASTTALCVVPGIGPGSGGVVLKGGF